MSGKKVSGKQAAIDFLREHNGGPLPVKDVTAEAAKRAGLKGKTPQATIAALIYAGAKKGETFKLVERGVVALVDGAAATAEAAKDEDSPAATPNAVVIRDGGKREARPDPKKSSGGRQKAAA